MPIKYDEGTKITVIRSDGSLFYWFMFGCIREVYGEGLAGVLPESWSAMEKLKSM